MSFQKSLFALLAIVSLMGMSSAQADLKYFKRGGVLQISGDASKGEEDKLQAQLTPDVKVILLLNPSKSNWTDIRDMAKLIEKAEVTTVIHGNCTSFICGAFFLSGKQRMFSGALRPEASSLRIEIGEGYFPADNENKNIKWVDILDWYRNHSNLGLSNTKKLHVPFIRPPGTLPAESKLFFPVTAKTSKGSVVHCWGNKQSLYEDCEAIPDLDALKAGLVTTTELYVNTDEIKPAKDIVPPTPTGFANLGDTLPAPASDSCRENYKIFQRMDMPRAFVISSGGACYWSSAQAMTPYATVMNNCKTKSNTYECRFYAIDDKVVFTPFDQPLPEAAPAKTASN